MSTKKCCKTCQYFSPCQTSSDGWCRLRKIRVISDMALYALCHHWTQKPPSLPNFTESKIDKSIDHQLEFEPVLLTPERN